MLLPPRADTYPVSPWQPCDFDPATCSTGVAGALNRNYYCAFSSIGGSVPNGGGQLCFQTLSSCLNAPNACLLNGTYQCTPRPDLCGTGMAANSGSVWTCSSDLPAGALPNGGGNYCYLDQSSCDNALNACNAPDPFLGQLNSGNYSASLVLCQQNPATCATGVASGSGNVWTCPLDPPTGSVPAGSGEPCYDSAYDCLQGPNPCSINEPCIYDLASCATGQAAGMATSNWICPATRVPGAVPNGAGAMCVCTRAARDNCSHALTPLRTLQVLRL